jgi:hypothetical protein
MKNSFKDKPLTIDELVAWKENPIINPRTGKPIKQSGLTWEYINKVYTKNKSQVDDIIKKKDVKVELNTDNKKLNMLDNSTKIKLIDCNEDRDPISMNMFWVEENGIKQIVYPDDKLDQLVMYIDSKNIIRCFEKETLKYLKTYNMTVHPISMEEIPKELFDMVEQVNLIQIQENKTIENVALDVFQYFNKISIFVDYEWFLDLTKEQLIKFNYELRDFWLQNFSETQRQSISDSPILSKNNDSLINLSQEEIQKYVLSQMKQLLECDKEEFKYMINYIILGALGIVIPKIKELYPDFSFSF